ncbi:MAG: amidohydrolase family protein [Dehalococcoidia bacterium]
MANYACISADSHVFEPGDLWQKYTDAKFRAQAPRLVQQDGEDVIVADWGLASSPGMGVSAGKRPEEVKLRGTYAEAPKGAWDPNERLKDQAKDGIDAEVIYPTVGMSLYHAPDDDLMMALFRAYNDWLVEFCATHPRQYQGVAIVNTENIPAAVEEIQRAAGKGLRGVMIPAAPKPDQPFSDPSYYDPFWAAAQEADMPVSLHTFAAPVRAVEVADWSVTYTVATFQIQRSIAEMVFSGVFERFPKLKIISVENDVSWASNFMERMDHVHHRHRFWAGTQLKSGVMPSQFFRDHVYLTFIRDAGAAPLRHLIGVKNIMWSSDYPHADTSFPNSHKLIAEQFAGVPADELQRMVCDNVAELYHMN